MFVREKLDACEMMYYGKLGCLKFGFILRKLLKVVVCLKASCNLIEKLAIYIKFSTWIQVGFSDKIIKLLHREFYN